jgi:hypothetical protein
MTPLMLGNFRSRKYEANLVIDTSAYGDGDVLSDRVAITLDAKAAADGRPVSGTITQITLLDKDDEGAALDLVILDADVSLGTINGAPNISDTNAQQIVRVVPVATTNYTDVVGAKVAFPSFDPIDFEVAAGVLYIGAISRGTPTYTAASDLRVKLQISLHNVNK